MGKRSGQVRGEEVVVRVRIGGVLGSISIMVGVEAGGVC